MFPSCSDCEPFVGPAVALLNSHMGDFDTTEVPFSTLISSLFVFSFACTHKRFHAYHHFYVREVHITVESNYAIAIAALSDCFKNIHYDYSIFVFI